MVPQNLLIIIILVSVAFFYNKEKLVPLLEKNKSLVIGGGLLLTLVYLYLNKENFDAQPWDYQNSTVCGARKVQELGLNSDSEPIKTEYPETTKNVDFYIPTPFEAEPISF